MPVHTLTQFLEITVPSFDSWSRPYRTLNKYWTCAGRASWYLSSSARTWLDKQTSPPSTHMFWSRVSTESAPVIHPARSVQLAMSTGSISDVDDFQDAELLDGLLKFGSGKDSGAEESTEESSNCEGASAPEHTGTATSAKRRKTATSRKSANNGVAHEGKQVSRNAANARERARMRVLSKAFSRLKTTLPWVPADTKLSKLDTLRLASSYIAHLRQILASDKYDNGYIHPVNLVRTPPVVKPRHLQLAYSKKMFVYNIIHDCI